MTGQRDTHVSQEKRRQDRRRQDKTKRQETRAISHCRKVTWKVQLFGGYSCSSRVQVKAGP